MTIFILYNTETLKCKEIFYSLSKKFKEFIVDKISDCSIIVVIGGDGFFLKCLQKYFSYEKSFYGINGGTVGFLMNKYPDLTNISKTDKITVNPLEVKIKNQLYYAFNEISIIRNTTQISDLNIYINDQTFNLKGDGLIISSSLGSTGYNYSAGGPILPLESKEIILTAICPYYPRNWKGVVLDCSTIIKVKVNQQNKRSVNISIDNRIYVVSDLLEIKLSNIKVNLLFNEYKKYLFDRNFKIN